MRKQLTLFTFYSIINPLKHSLIRYSRVEPTKSEKNQQFFTLFINFMSLRTLNHTRKGTVAAFLTLTAVALGCIVAILGVLATSAAPSDGPLITFNN